MPGPTKRTEPTPEQRAMIDRYVAGESAAAIADDLGVARRSVYNALELGGVDRRRKMHSLSPEQVEAVVARYLAGEPVLQISRDFPEVHLVTVHNAIKGCGIATRPDLAKRRVPTEWEHLVVDACKKGNHVIDGERIADVARRFGVSDKTVGRILRRHDVDLLLGRPRLHTLDEAAFDDPADRDAAYWSGFLAADGHLTKDRPVIILGISEVDRDHVEEFREFLGSTHAITTIPAKIARGIGHFADLEIHTGACVYFSVHSARLTEALIARGMTKKNHDRCPISWLADSPDYWRGCVDGDGWLGRIEDDRSRAVYPRIGFCGYPPVVDAFITFMRRRTGAVLTPHENNRSTKIRGTGTSGDTAKRAIDLLYGGDPPTALARKLAIAKSLLAK